MFATKKGDKPFHLDLILGATLPNNATYKLTPEQNAELARQIEELLAKGFLRESVSPFVVTIVLAPKKEATWRLFMNSRAIKKITINIGSACQELKIFWIL